MQTIKVRTTQNVMIDYPIAGVFDRILAFLLDSFIWLAYLFLTLFVLTIAGARTTWLLILMYLPIFLYHPLFEIFMNGQTPGKRALNIRVVRLDGNSPTIANYILRFLLWPIDVLFWGSVAIVCISLTRNGQRLGDLPAGTTVIKEVKKGPVTSQQIVKSLASDYTPVFIQVVQLTDQDMRLIKEALDMNLRHGNPQPMLVLTQKIKSMLGIQSDLPPIQFLYTILKDYHHLTSGLS